MFWLNQECHFPDPRLADAEGLIAIGGDLKPERILNAYRNGIFPWYNEDPILWWSPDPRFVLFPKNLKISKSMKRIMKKGIFEFSINRSFKSVIQHCASIKRQDQQGTWLNNNMQDAYCHLHDLGYAHSVECWYDQQLVGGLYGISIGKCFFGESMFSLSANASKAAFIFFMERLSDLSYTMVDCQIYSDHLHSLGSDFITRNEFLTLLQNNRNYPEIGFI